ncbi:MAG: hypothetical protein ACP5HK_05010 [Acidilobus sp.]
MECAGLLRVAAGLVALGMTKEMLRATLHYDFHVDVEDEGFERLYAEAASCVERGLVKVRTWSTPFRPGDCENEVVKEIGAMVLRGMDLDQIEPVILRRHYMLREGAAYRVLTQRDVEYAYDVAILCLSELRRRARGA